MSNREMPQRLVDMSANPNAKYAEAQSAPRKDKSPQKHTEAHGREVRGEAILFHGNGKMPRKMGAARPVTELEKDGTCFRSSLHNSPYRASRFPNALHGA
ncbi:hypothetical protein D6779_05625 [Candidatus Parcubacteria bacterium]|nr:MAG: hypothetical protein D6779_05625 [Candidatus Parcubacteria bacterium]